MLDIEGDEEDVTQGLESSASVPSPSIATFSTVGSTIAIVDSLQSRMMSLNVVTAGLEVTSDSLKRKRQASVPEYIGVDEDEEILDYYLYVTPV